MMKNLGIGILIASFSLSSVNAGLAQGIQAGPTSGHPYDLAVLSQQMLEQDRINREQELVINGLSDDYPDTAVARKQEAALEKINQTMFNYRNYLLSRNQAQTKPNNQKVSRYDDLIKLTQYADKITGVSNPWQLKTLGLAQQFEILDILDNEMIILNKRLKEVVVHKALNKAEVPVQEATIRMLTQQLAQKDQKIAHLKTEIQLRNQAQVQVEVLKEQLVRQQTKADSFIKTEVLAREEAQAHVGALKKQWAKQQNKTDSFIKTEVLAKKEAQAQIVALKQQLILQQTKADSLMKTEVQAKEETQAQVEALKQQLSLEQTKADSLKQELKTKNAQFDKMTATMEDNQQKLQMRINWLSHILIAANKRAQYDQSMLAQDQVSLSHLQQEIQKNRNDFALQFNKQDEENKIQVTDLKNRMQELTNTLGQRQQQLDLLNTTLKNKITEEKNQAQQEALEVKAKDEAIHWLRKVLAISKEKTEYYQLGSKQGELSLKQPQENSMQIVKSRMEELTNELGQEEQQVASLTAELKDKIAEEKSQDVLTEQIQDFKAQLQDKGNQMAAMNKKIQAGEEAQAQVDTLKQQLSQQQSKTDSLKKELDITYAQADKMTAMMENYQKKLEAKNNAYNEALGLVLQDKAAQRNSQVDDLSLSTAQKKMMDEKDKELKDLKIDLALARQKSDNMPNSDEMEFLRAGLKKAEAQLKQKDDTILQLQNQLNQFKTSMAVPADAFSKNDPVHKKLKQALDKINAQGLVINKLVQKLQDAGQSVDLTHDGGR